MTELREMYHPGSYIEDSIEALGMTQSEFAARVGLSVKTISQLISGDANITFETANKFSEFFHCIIVTRNRGFHLSVRASAFYRHCRRIGELRCRYQKRNFKRVLLFRRAIPFRLC